MNSHPFPQPLPQLLPKKPFPPPQQHRIRISQIQLNPLPPFPHPQSQPQFVAATSLMIVPPLKFNYTVSYDLWLAHVSKFFKKFLLFVGTCKENIV